MQKDMHYYGTYVMARAAGIGQRKAQVIASAAQFVDDNAASKGIEFKDGGALQSRATAHHWYHLSNIDTDDQRYVWVPFHFLPGNEGEKFSERLVCRKNSGIAQAMVANHLDHADKIDFSDELIGIAAHVYADTFSHYGFSGVSSRLNQIDNDSFKFHDIPENTEKYIKKRQKKFKRNYSKEAGLLANIKSWFAETLSGALGHGAACTFPDRPYLKWEFEYDHAGCSGLRDNPKTFLEACEALHGMFVRYTEAKEGVKDSEVIPFDEIRSQIKSIIEFKGYEEEGSEPTEDARINRWKKAVAEDNILGAHEVIPEYLGDEWLKEKSRLHGQKLSQSVKEKDVYQFYQAASYHRHYILRNLLPENNLIVS
ncbi:DUF6765 family protein [Maridesulfovibrio sp.]|uniref:DUF6765 family protein n=1 Tax=Maridesulfovibrio sp. TaxID=2795000 RepID=UPI003BAA2755